MDGKTSIRALSLALAVLGVPLVLRGEADYAATERRIAEREPVIAEPQTPINRQQRRKAARQAAKATKR